MPQDSDQLDLDSLYMRAIRGGERLDGKPYYEESADSLFYFFQDGASNAHRIDGLITLYRSIESGELVGIQIKRIRKFIQELAKKSNVPPVITVKFILQHAANAENKLREQVAELMSMPEAEQALPEEVVS